MNLLFWRRPKEKEKRPLNPIDPTWDTRPGKIRAWDPAFRVGSGYSSGASMDGSGNGSPPSDSVVPIIMLNQ